jgi:hypothetical protein
MIAYDKEIWNTYLSLSQKHNSAMFEVKFLTIHFALKENKTIEKPRVNIPKTIHIKLRLQEGLHMKFYPFHVSN